MRPSWTFAIVACALLAASFAPTQMATAALTVAHTPPTGVATGEPIPIEVEITADEPVLKVEILPVSSNAFENFTLSLAHGTASYGVWDGQIPAQSAAGVLEYRVEVTRADGWTQDYDYNVTVYGSSSEGGFIDLPEEKWVLFVAGIIILAVFFILEIPLKRRWMDRLERKNKAVDGERRKAKRVKKP